LKIVQEAVLEFPKHGSKTIGKLLFTKHPEWFGTLEAAYSLVRRQRGAHGPTHRSGNRRMAQPDKPHGKAVEPVYPGIPQPREEVEDWAIVHYPGPLRVGILNDVHVPFHDPQTIEMLCDEWERRKINFLLINGDLIDWYGISKYECNPTLRDTRGDRDDTVQLLKYLRGRFPRARIVVKLGNHDERWEAMLARKSPEIFGFPEFRVEQVLQLADPKIRAECVRDLRPISFGSLFVIHGHEYRFAISNPVNAARGLFLRGKTLAACGHFHQYSNHSENTLAGKLITTWSMGCACHLHPQYHPLNNWCNGGAYVEVSKDGVFEFENWRIVNGKLY
jgi:hypothetical protein